MWTPPRPHRTCLHRRVLTGLARIHREPTLPSGVLGDSGHSLSCLGTAMIPDPCRLRARVGRQVEQSGGRRTRARGPRPAPCGRCVRRVMSSLQGEANAFPIALLGHLPEVRRGGSAQPRCLISVVLCSLLAFPHCSHSDHKPTVQPTYRLLNSLSVLLRPAVLVLERSEACFLTRISGAQHPRVKGLTSAVKILHYKMPEARLNVESVLFSQMWGGVSPRPPGSFPQALCPSLKVALPLLHVWVTAPWAVFVGTVCRFVSPQRHSTGQGRSFPGERCP